MLRPLKNLIKEKTLARISFHDGISIEGFVTYADEDTFEIYGPDNVYNQSVLEESEDGIVVQNEDDAESIDFTFVKGVFLTDNIYSIISDISHKYPIEKIMYIDKMKESIYKNIEQPRVFKLVKKAKKENEDGSNE